MESSSVAEVAENKATVVAQIKSILADTLEVGIQSVTRSLWLGGGSSWCGSQKVYLIKNACVSWFVDLNDKFTTKYRARLLGLWKRICCVVLCMLMLRIIYSFYVFFFFKGFWTLFWTRARWKGKLVTCVMSSFLQHVANVRLYKNVNNSI